MQKQESSTQFLQDAKKMRAASTLTVALGEALYFRYDRWRERVNMVPSFNSARLNGK